MGRDGKDAGLDVVRIGLRVVVNNVVGVSGDETDCVSESNLNDGLREDGLREDGLDRIGSFMSESGRPVKETG